MYYLLDRVFKSNRNTVFWQHSREYGTILNCSKQSFCCFWHLCSYSVWQQNLLTFSLPCVMLKCLQRQMYGASMKWPAPSRKTTSSKCLCPALSIFSIICFNSHKHIFIMLSLSKHYRFILTIIWVSIRTHWNFGQFYAYAHEREMIRRESFHLTIFIKFEYYQVLLMRLEYCHISISSKF